MVARASSRDIGRANIGRIISERMHFAGARSMC